MASRRWKAVALAAAVLGAGLAVVVPGVASADGSTPVEVSCSGVPIVNTLAGTANVEASDDVDPVVAGGVVNNTLHVPVPVEDPPVSLTITEVKINVPIPSGVTIDDVTFTASSFTGQTWSVSGSNLQATFTGSVVIASGQPIPTVPDVKMKTTVAGPPRTIEWKAPTSIVAKANWALGSFTANCTPTAPNTVLISTTVVNPNQAPTATDQSLTTPYQTAKAVTLGGTDPESSPLTFSVATQPSHGTLSGTVPNLTYTPANGYSGPDSFTFTASDGSLSDIGTISITVDGAVASVPGAPSITGAVPSEGQVALAWDAPASDGGSAITGYVITPIVGGVPGTPIDVAASPTTKTVTGLANGVAHTFTVAAKNGVGTGAASAASTAVTPQWWLPWSSGTVAVTEIFTWMTGTAPTSTEKTSWLGQLNGGTKLPGDLVASLRTGPDALGNVDPTARLYAAYLNRIPDASGLNFWLNRRRNGWKLSKISDSFAASNEFKTRYGSLSNKVFVDKIYEDVLGRPPETAGAAYWTAKLDSKKMTRGQVMINFSESNEYKTKQARNVDAAIIFIHFRGKTPTLTERNDFAAALVGGTPLATLVRQQIHLLAFDTRAG